RLLKRQGDNASKNIVLISSESALMPLAGAVGFHVDKNLQNKPAIPPSPLEGKEMPDNSDGEELPDEDLDNIDEKDAKLDYHRTVGGLAAVKALDDAETIPIEDEEDAPAAKPKKAPTDKKIKVPNYDRFRLMLFGGIGALIL